MNIESLKGQIKEDQYKEVHFFRKGGMGEIYSAIDTETGLKKAIKVVPVENEEEFGLLKSEFEISKELVHKNIIDTEYFNEFINAGIRYIYCIMPFNEKGSLRDLLTNQVDKFSLRDSLKLMLDLAEGLAFAHKKVVHRDLKPENILLDSNSNLQICDFGLAKLIDAKTRTKTFKGSGTLPYMAPECWIFDSNTFSMDIYSLGIIFYELLTLEMPFVGRTENEFRNKHLYEALPNISNKRVDVPVRLVEVVNKMTKKRHQERYSSMGEVVAVLKEITLKIEEKNDSKIDALLNKANQKISASEQAELKRQKEQAAIETELKFIEFSKKSIFDLFNNRIIELNQSLEREKISINGNSNNFRVGFMEKSFSISYYPNSDIPIMLQKRKDVILQHQKSQYGFVMQTPQATYLEKDNVVLIGQVSLSNGSHNRYSYGYNLLLRRTDLQDLYGEWWVVWFDDSAIINKHPLDYHYPLNIPDFYQEYEYGRGRAMHVRSMGMNSLKNEGIDSLIEKILE
ncbi:MAG TPA: serine/threonine-protein kinase [Saprospiraceae bacterium]|nr:serine/threonine-protein kinase [Saprospiraceae bacterium]